MNRQKFTGRDRNRKTRFAVRFSERLARVFITIGGIGTILAVALILVFLSWVVVPLFRGATVDATTSAGGLTPGAAPLALLVDESLSMTAVLGSDGSYEVLRFASGERVSTQPAPAEAPTSASRTVDGNRLTFGYAGGSLRWADAGFEVSFPSGDEIPARHRELERGTAVEIPGGVLERAEDGSFLRHTFAMSWSEPVELEVSDPIVLVDQVPGETLSSLCVLTAADELLFLELSQRKNLLTGKVTHTAQRYELPYEPSAEHGRPWKMLLAGSGNNLYLLWKDGRLERWDVRDPGEPEVAQLLDVVPEDGESVTAASFLIGRSTLMIGDSLGRIRAWFPSKPENAGTVDGVVLVNGKELPQGDAPVALFAPSTRSRLLLGGFEDGAIGLYHVTSSQRIGAATVEQGIAPRALGLFPTENGIVALAGEELIGWEVDPRHPEASLGALFRPVWYEGYEGPQHAWQSSSATDEYEPKLGLLPLIFGTLKATLYSMLFGAPLAILAAIYTSEFLDRRLRSPIKSVIEIMASLPSVVLGFLGALVIAPYVNKVLPATLAALLTVPLALLIGAYLWQLIPRNLALRVGGFAKLLAIFACLPLGIWIASRVGPGIEAALFAGDLELWLDGQGSDATGGWFILLLPAGALAIAFALGRVSLFRASHSWSHGKTAGVDLMRFAIGALLAAGVAFVVAKSMNTAGLDPRGGIVGTYVQRNALIVGFVMGFAIVPIIYTLAEDALSSIPDHLRVASLGAGATPWQTAMRVVVPTGMSGIFSALMIGLGRAVGETMIVLMATGNTPIMDWNVFNGFRTLSANIAVELPEAVQNSTHYRTLFLAALVLFAMTFVLNTFAELVRQRFRRRAFQL